MLYASAVKSASATVIALSGTPRERGRIHGETLRAQIGERLERAMEDLAHERSTYLAEVERYLENFIKHTGFVAAMSRWTPEVLSEIKGIAEGAAIGDSDALVLNLMDELAWHSPASGDDESCSAVGIHRTQGPALAGQTMDLSESYDGSQVVLSIDSQDSRTIVLTSAGMVALCGVNSDGVGVFCNQLLSLRPSHTGLPAAAVVRGALARKSFSQARELIGGVEHASGQNYLLASSDQIVNLECSASGVREDQGRERVVTHTNHPLASRDLAQRPEKLRGFSGSTHERLGFLQAQAPRANSYEDLQAILSDRSTPICKIPGPDGRQLTFGAIIAELSSPPRVWVAPGPPDRTAWNEFHTSPGNPVTIAPGSHTGNGRHVPGQRANGVQGGAGFG